MMTTANAFLSQEAKDVREQAAKNAVPADPPPPAPVVHTVAERMAKLRVPVKEFLEAQSVAQNPEEMRAVLMELQTMFGYGSPRGRELCAKALRLLEARLGGTITPGVGCHKLNINKENT